MKLNLFRISHGPHPHPIIPCGLRFSLVALALTGCTQGSDRLGTAAGSVAAPQSPTPQPKRGTAADTGTRNIVAVVNAQPVTSTEVDAWLADTIREQPHLLDGSQENKIALSQVRAQGLEDLILFRLMLQEADRQKITVTPSEIERAERNQAASPASGAPKVKPYPARNTTEPIRAQAAQQIKIDKLVERWVAPVTLQEAEVREFYREHPDYFRVRPSARASHIVLLVKRNAPAAERQKVQAQARKVLAMALAPGADFAALARRYSEDGTRSSGGNVGEFHPGEMVRPFSDAVFAPSARPGKVLPALVVSDFGFHIIRIWEKTPASTISLARARRKIYTFLLHNKRVECVDRHKQALHKNAKVQIL